MRVAMNDFKAIIFRSAVETNTDALCGKVQRGQPEQALVQRRCADLKNPSLEMKGPANGFEFGINLRVHLIVRIREEI